MHRREFLGASAAFGVPWLRAAERFDLVAIERPRVIPQANRYLAAQPVTVTRSSLGSSARLGWAPSAIQASNVR